MKALIAQAQPSQPQPQAQPVLSPDFFASLGVTGLILVSLAVAIAKTLPNYLDHFFRLKVESTKARIDAESKEAAVDLQLVQGNNALITDIIKTLLANQLQTAKQFQEEVVSVQQLQSTQTAIAQKDIEKLAANQQRFFEIGAKILDGQAEIKLEIERNRKVYQQQPRALPPQPSQLSHPPQLPNIPS
jgi:hypothetical protein